MNRHLVTGATGFVGSALVLELLARTDSEIVCLVRGKTPEACRERLERALRQASKAYAATDEQPLSRETFAERVRVLRGDILAPGCAAEQVCAVSELWHSAASLKYEDEARQEILAHNVGGTINVLDLARSAGATRFNYISTAYVSGSRTGEIAEDAPSRSSETNNWYERSKLQAEEHVLAQDDLQVRILRPSIVIGHSRTLAATSFTGFYGFIREFVGFQRKVSRRLGNILAFRPLNLRANPESTLNFVPIDMVVRDAVSISLSASAEPYFHLTHPSPPTVGESIGALFSRLGVRQPRFLRERASFTALDQHLDRALSFYSSYLDHPKVFGRTNTLACGAGVPALGPRTAESLLPHIDWYLQRLSQAQPRQPNAPAERADRVASR